MSDCPTPAKAAWRSLDDLSGSTELQDFAAQEFPGFANIYESLGEAELAGGTSLTRRQFLALSAAGLGMAGLAGCRRPDLEVLPYTEAPDDVLYGLPTYYATNIPRPGGSFPVLVESHTGRPTKMEGHPNHPTSQGATDTLAQASILDLYTPERSADVLRNGIAKTWGDFELWAGDHFAKLRSGEEDGTGLHLLAEDFHSPAVTKLRQYFQDNLPGAVWHTHEPVNDRNAIAGATLAFDQPLRPQYHLNQAQRILALDADFLALNPANVAHTRAFTAGRRIDRPGDAMNRLYVVENTLTVTGGMADHRLRLPASHHLDYLIALVRVLLQDGELKVPAELRNALEQLPASDQLAIPQPWLTVVAEDLREHRGQSLIMVGDRQPPLAHALAHTINGLLGNQDQTVTFQPALAPEENDLNTLVEAIGKDEVQTLVILGGNPVYTSPGDIDLASKLARVPAVIRAGLFVDETSRAMLESLPEVGERWHLPLAHFLESWGDTESPDGTYAAVQPLIAPLHSEPDSRVREQGIPPARGGRTPLEILIQLVAFDGILSYRSAHERARKLVEEIFAERFAETGDATDPAKAFRRFLQAGFLPNSAAATVDPKLPFKAVAKAITGYQPAAPVAVGNLELVFHPDYRLYDGRFVTNRWLQELPDPVTKLTWDNAALISPATARELALKTEDVVSLTMGERTLDRIPVFVLPGQADNSISVHLGHGRMPIEHIPSGGGFNVYPLRTTRHLNIATGLTIAPIGERYPLATTQEHGAIPEGRSELIIHELTQESYQEQLRHPHSEHQHGPEEKPSFQAGYPHQETGPNRRFPLDLSTPELLDSQHQWGMVIDLNSCTGCSACMVACQSENNVPVVGKPEVIRHREMHWIRVDRYFTTELAGDVDDPMVVTQPLACVHCEQAPCETVCPVNAAVHSPEGLNLQVYNRCIGTRYCGNNCPYKVRRFNWFNYNLRPLDELREGILSDIKEVPATMQMQKNPDVTVRGRGVMEKCTYCVQRIERGKTGAKLAATAAGYAKPKDAAEAREKGYDLVERTDGSKGVLVPDGIITPACVQACPAEAITFGNVRDTSSKVYRMKQKAGDFLVLGELNTKPRTSHHPRIRNLNPAMRPAQEGSE